MKVILALVGLLLVGTQGFRIAPQHDGVELSGNFIDKLLKKSLEYGRKLLKENEPLAIPDLPAQTIIDDDVNMNVKFTNVKVSQASNFKINKMSTNMNDLTAQFEVALPTLHLEGKHEVSGKAFGEDVKGSGTFSVELKNFVQDGHVQFYVNGHSFQTKNLELSYDLEAAEFALSGVEASSMNNDQIVTFLNTQLLSTLKENQAFVCEKVANHVVDIANQLTEGKSLMELVKWLKNAIKN